MKLQALLKKYSNQLTGLSALLILIAYSGKYLLKKAAGVQKGSGEPNKTKVASVTKAQIKEIAELKMPDLNASSVETAMSMIEGTAKSMGFTVTD